MIAVLLLIAFILDLSLLGGLLTKLAFSLLGWFIIFALVIGAIVLMLNGVR